MEIGLIFPNKDRRYKTVHLGLAYIVAYARLYHNDVIFTVLDTRVATKKETKKFLYKKFDLIGISVFSPIYFEVKKICAQLNKYQKDVPICLGGPYVTTIMQEIFVETPADFAVYGEGEETFSQLISFLKGNDKLENISGLMYKDEQNIIHTNPRRKRINDLDQLPIPAFDIFPMDKYPLHRIVSSRGCPYSCVWCNSKSIWKDGFYSMSAEKVIIEVEYLLSNYGKKNFDFGDNTFNYD